MCKYLSKILAIAAVTIAVATFATTVQVSALPLIEGQAQDEGGCPTLINPQGRNCQNPHDIEGDPPVRSCNSPNRFKGELPVSCRQ